jgi:hypothetical protein
LRRRQRRATATSPPRRSASAPVADNGSNWFVSGAPDDRWDNDALVGELRQVQGQHFEVVRMTGLVAG